MFYYLIPSAVIAPFAAAFIILITGSKRLENFAKPLSLIAVGLLITISLSHLLPEAMEESLNPHSIGFTVLIAVLVLIGIEMFFNSHSHKENVLSKGAAGLLCGTFLHAFCDGIILVSSYLVDIHLGLAVTAAILIHEVPQEIGDYVILLDCGMSRTQAFSISLISGCGAICGAILGYFLLDTVKGLLPYALAVSASSFIYVSLCDLLPRLYKSQNQQKMLYRFFFLLIGVIAALLISHHH